MEKSTLILSAVVFVAVIAALVIVLICLSRSDTPAVTPSKDWTTDPCDEPPKIEEIKCETEEIISSTDTPCSEFSD